MSHDAHDLLDPLPRPAGDAVLRRLAPSDLAGFQAYRHDPRVGQYQGWTAEPDAQALRFLAEMGEGVLLQPGIWSQIGIADARTLQLVGDIGLLLAAGGREAEIGFSLARHAQGRGIGTAAVREAIALVFERTGAQQVIAITDARNLASIRLLERVGLRRVGSQHTLFRGEPCEELRYVLARPETAPPPSIP